MAWFPTTNYETAENPSTKEHVNKRNICIYFPPNGILYSNEKEQTTNIHNKMDKSHNIKQKRAHIESTLYNSTVYSSKIRQNKAVVFRCIFRPSIKVT